MKTIITIAVAVVVLLVGGVWSSRVLQGGDSPELISANGLHWHPELSIYIKGEKQTIPAGIGLGAVHSPIHTHDPDNIIHLEFEGRVLEKDIVLGQFFKNWGKDIQSFGMLQKMTVSGEENSELGNYVMRDGDKIELWYE